MDDEPSRDMLRLRLDVQLDREPISGVLRDESGAEAAFVGWLGFVEALSTFYERRAEG